MNSLQTTIIIFSIFIVLICIFSIFILLKNDRLLDLIYKIDESNNLMDGFITKKYEYLNKLISIIEKKIKINSKKIHEIKKINIEVINKIELDNILELAYNEIREISSDYTKVASTKSFTELMDKLNDNEIHLISLRTFYNKCVVEYNNILRVFPNSMIAKIKKYDLKVLYEGKELNPENKMM